MFAAGDTVYESGSAADYANYYDPTWGRFKARTLPSPGNHEYYTSGAAGYFGYFGAAAGEAGKGWYSTDIGTWHVVVLNSNCGQVDCTASSEQVQWLRADLAASGAACTVAIMHAPRFSSGTTHGSTTTVSPIWQALQDYDAELVLTGHEHDYERFAPQTVDGVADPVHGIREIVVGTGGRSLYTFGTPIANSEVRSSTYGVLKLDLHPGSYDFEFVPIAGSSFTDSGSGICHDASGLVTSAGPLNGDTPISDPSFSDGDVVAGTEYTYNVTAVDAVGQESDPSDPASATPTAPDNTALDFDGASDYVTFGPASNLNLNVFTIETWFRRDGPGVAASTTGGTGGVTAIPLLTKGRSETGATEAWFLGIDQATSRIAADFESASDDSNHGLIGTTTIQDGRWYHAAATYDGTTFRLYLNGLLEASVAVANGPGTSSAHHAALATALSTAGVPAGYFDGAIDEARVWNVARSGPQILASRDQQLTSGTGLIARWGLNEGSGTTALSSVAGGPTGTAVGNPTWVNGFEPPAPNQPPDAPTLGEPANGATGVSTSATLSVDVSDPDGDPLDTTFYGRATAGPTAPDFTVVTLPDTQYYTKNLPYLPEYQAQIQWIIDTRDDLNTAFVAHLGDMVDDLDTYPVEWQRADQVQAVLDASGIPNSVNVGNHDMATNGTAAGFDQYFPPSRYEGNAWYGGYLGGDPGDPVNRLNRDSYQLFSVGDLDFIVINVEYDMPAYAVQWAAGLLDQYPDRLAIFVTHLFINTSGSRPTSTYTRSDGTSAEAVWQQLISPHCNVVMVVNGHYPGLGRRTDLNSCGQPVPQILTDYQSYPNGGDGLLRYYTFKPSENKVYAYTYSPTRNGGAGEFLTDTANQFVYDVDLGGGTSFRPIATVTGTPSGGTATTTWTGLAGHSDYEWYASASDGTASATSDTWSFATGADSIPPEAPANVTAAGHASSVSVSWTPNAELDLAGYNVYRSETSPVSIAGTPLNGGTLITGTTFDDPTTELGTVYHYVVTAVDSSDNESLPSAEVVGEPGVMTGAALSFDGFNDYVTFGNAAGLNATDFTIETWFRRDGAGVGVTTGTGGIPSAIPLVAKGAQQAETPANVNMNWFLGLDASSGVLVADFEDTAGGVNHPVSGVTPVTSGVWHHAAATYDATSGTWKLYLDGVLDGTLVLASAFQPEDTSIQHGSLGTSLNATGGTNGFFNGALDEVRVWNVVRTGTDIATNRDSALTSGAGLIARYGLDEGAGSTVSSSVVGAPTGTLTNGPTWVEGGPVAGGPDVTAPAAPVGLIANGDADSINLTWIANAEIDLAGYNVYRSTTSPVDTAGTPLNGGTLLTSPAFDDTSAASGTVYYYAVTATDVSDNESLPSAQVQGQVGVTANTALSFDGVNDYVTFGSNPGLAATSFTVETWFRRDGAGVGVTTGNLGITSAIPLVSKGGAEQESPANINMNWFLGIDASSGVLVADFEDTINGTNHPVAGTTPIPVSATTWHHAAVDL